MVPAVVGEDLPRGCRPSRALGWIGLVLLCLVVYLPGFFWIPPVDRDESRFAQASRQMFESVALSAGYRDPARHGGGLAVPMVQDRERLNKPPLIYWLQAGSAAVLTWGNPWRDEIWMYRVPSLLAAAGLVLVVWRVGGELFDGRTGRLGAALVAVSPVVVLEAHQARADMVMVLCTAVAQWAMWRVFAGAREGAEEGRWGTGRWAVVFWVAMAAGVMTKGPITPLVCGLTAVGVSAVAGRWGWLWRLRPVVGVVIVAAAVGPWVWAVAERVGWERYWGTVVGETLGRSVSAKEGHWGPPGYHTILLAVLFWPGSLLTGLGVALAVRRGFAGRRERGLGEGRAGLRERFRRGVEARAEQEPYLFLLAWIVPAWVVFELVGTKLPHYTMPMYPAVAILSARAVLAADAGLLAVKGRGARAGLVVWVVIGVAIGCVVPVVVAYGGALSTPVSPLLPVAAVLCAVIVAYLMRKAWRALKAGKYGRAVLTGVVVNVWVSVLVLGVVMPAGWSLWISRNMEYAMRKQDPGGSRPIAAAGYGEDSLIFLTRGRIERIGVGEAREWVRRNPDGLIWAPREAGIRYEDYADAGGNNPPGVESPEIHVVDGYNYSRGKVETYYLHGVRKK